MTRKPIDRFSEIPEGVFGQYLLTPKISLEKGLHIYQLTNYLKERGRKLGVDLRIDVQLHPQGVLFTWERKVSEE